MKAINTVNSSAHRLSAQGVNVVSETLNGTDISIGSGFRAASFRAGNIGETMDPLVMVDHYVMTEPTFGAHPHAGMSAVSLLFEDSEGLFHNRDSLGNDFDLLPGDLYWLSAGSGAVHDESPRANARTHGLQVFVNVPQAQRFRAPTSLLVRSKDMPVIKTAEYRVKVVLGETSGVRGATSPSTPLTILDGTIQPARAYSYRASDNHGIWLQSVEGSIDVVVGESARQLTHGQAIAVKVADSTEIAIRNPTQEAAHFVLFDGAQISESFVQDGPFVMGTQHQITDIKAAYEAGRFGGIENGR